MLTHLMLGGQTNPDGMLLHRFEFDTDTTPLQSVPLPLETCAVEKVEGRTPEEVGVLISGVGKAAKSRKGGGFKAMLGSKIGEAADLLKKEEAGMYRLSGLKVMDGDDWLEGREAPSRITDCATSSTRSLAGARLALMSIWA